MKPLPPSMVAVGSVVAFIFSALTFAGFTFGGEILARLLGGVAFGLLGVWFLFLYRRARHKTA